MSVVQIRCYRSLHHEEVRYERQNRIAESVLGAGRA